MKFATVVTGPGGYLESLEASCDRNHVRLDKLGWGDEWRGWRWRSETILTYLQQDCDPDDVVCIFDGYDVVVLADEEEILSKFRSKQCDILLSTERKSHPIYRFASWYQNSGKCDQRYLNGGCYMGYARALTRLIQASLVYYDRGYNDDQEILTLLCKSRFAGLQDLVVKYDHADIYFNRICDTDSLWEIVQYYLLSKQDACGDALTISDGRLVVDKKHRPCIVHFPGKVKFDFYLTRLGLPIPSTTTNKTRHTLSTILILVLLIYNLVVRDFDRPMPIDVWYDLGIPLAMAYVWYLDKNASNKLRHPECVENGVGVLNMLGVVLRVFHLFLGYFVLNLVLKNLVSPIVWKEYLVLVLYVLVINYLVVGWKRCLLTIIEHKLLRVSPMCTAFGKLDRRNQMALEQGFMSPDFFAGNRGYLLILIVLTIKLYRSH